MTIDSLREFGANVDEGLERCMGMEDFYIEMIELGMSDERFELLGKNLEAKDLEEAFETVHALKGVIGNLAPADRLCKPVRTEFPHHVPQPGNTVPDPVPGSCRDHGTCRLY